MNITSLRTALLTGSAALSIVASGPAHADSASASAQAENDSSAIIVTAQKRSERVTDVPMSVNAVSGTQLSRVGVSDMTQLDRLVPGFNFQKSAFGTPILYIRGIGFNDNSASAPPAVTAYVDQVALPYSVMTRGALFDLERVEVLKGPQGTLFGMNSTGGAVNFVAARPTDKFEAGFDASYARFNETDLSGYLSGPIASGLTGRVAVQYENSDGWQRSATRPDDRLGAKDFLNGRITLDWDANDDLKFQFALSAWRDRSETQAAQYQQFTPAVPVTPLTQYIADAMLAAPIAGASPREADWDPGRDYKRDDNFIQGSVRADWDINAGLTLTSITSYSEFNGQAPVDLDGTAFTAFNMSSNESDISSFAQELRLAGENGPIRWMFGGNYQDDSTNEVTASLNQGTNNQIGPFLFTSVGQLANQDIKTASLFGSVDYNLTSSLTLQASARYSDQKRDFEGCLFDNGIGPVGVSMAQAFSLLSSVPIPTGSCVTLDPVTFQPVLAKSELNEDNVSWRIGANYKLSADAMVYGNVTKGFKSGSYSLVPGILASQFAPVTQESVLAYEIGAKASVFDGRMDVDAAAFYNDYRNKQLKGIVLTPVFGPLPQLVNIPESSVIGVEFNVTVRPISGLKLSTGVTYVASRVDEDPAAPAIPLDPFGVPTSYVGEAFPNTPRWQVVADGEYGFPLGGNLDGYVGAALTYRSNSSAAFGRNPIFDLTEVTLLDLRAGVESKDGHWSGQLWGRNVTNEYYWTNVTHLTDYVSRLAGMPATYGLSLSYRY